MTGDPRERTEQEWRALLQPQEFMVLRQAGTEHPGTGALLNEKRVGKYYCRGCEQFLFASDAKFDSGCGWPSFFEAAEGAVIELEDRSLGRVRTEIRCARCDSHLGHVFPDAPQTPTGLRYCMNSVALVFEEE